MSEIQGDLDVYTYLSISTALVFTALGTALGWQADVLAGRSETDLLTGLYNARGLSRRLNDELARFKRYGAPLALLLLDVDGLKEINDRFGHSAGDRALVHVADAVRGELRSSDIGARWGGDEFAIVAPNTTTDAAQSLAERVRTSIARLQVPWRLSVSIGAMAIDTVNVEQPTTVTAMMQIADAALYDAKNRGRNSVVLSSSECK
jgi:diguanylate cyclase (GGDEF)-like protein